MTKNPTPIFQLKPAELGLLGLLGFVELTAAVIFLAVSAAKYPGVFLFGYAERGIVELVLVALLAIAFLALALMAFLHPSKLEKWSNTGFFRYKWVLVIIIVAGIISGWAAATIPPEFFGRFGTYYQWVRPAGIAAGLIGLQFLALYLWRAGQFSAIEGPLKWLKSPVFWLSFGIALALFFLSYFTKFGLVADTPLWNVPGVPVSGIQIFLAILALTGLLVFYKLSAGFRRLLKGRTGNLVIILLLFTAALLVWGLTPLNGDSLAIEPSLANPQPYPQRDARVHDLGALSVLYGEGINFKDYTDKPLYMVILAVLHLVAGYDYNQLQWVQIVILAIIPVLVYLLGMRIHSNFFGVLIAIIVILQQRNAVVLSRMISAVNVKLLVTETFVLLGIILLALLLFKWEERNDSKVVLALGGVVGSLSLIRLNPLLFIPFIGLVIIIVYWKRKRLLLTRLLLFAAGFAVIFTPWVISGTNAKGEPYLFIKVRDIFEHRISPQLNNSESEQAVFGLDEWGLSINRAGFSAVGLNLTDGLDQMEVDQAGFINPDTLFKDEAKNNGGVQYLKLMTNHYVHNLMTSILPLPDVLSRTGIRVLAQRDYWDDGMIWDGNLSSGLIRFIIINLGLVSLGIAYSWKAHRWKGLIPLGLLLVYNLAISISLTSGGRYIVPIIWIVFLYYALGIFVLLEALIGLIKPGEVVDFRFASDGTGAHKKTGMVSVYIGLVVVALMVPISNQLVPLCVTTNPAERSAALFNQLGPVKEEGKTYLFGVVLYPVFYPGRGRVHFDFYQGDKVLPIRLDLFPQGESSVLSRARLKSGEPARLEFDLEDQVTGVTIFRDGAPLEYWSLVDESQGNP